jgi:putative copper export protein
VSVLYLASVWLHIIGAALWLGGMLLLVLVVVPVLRERTFRDVAPALVDETGTRFRAVGWVALALLVATGLLNVAVRGIGRSALTDPGFWQSAFGRLLALKLLVVAGILAVSMLHDFAVGPAATARWRQHPAASESQRLRRRAAWLGRLNLLLGLVAVALGVMLVRGGP